MIRQIQSCRVLEVIAFILGLAIAPSAIAQTSAPTNLGTMPAKVPGWPTADSDSPVFTHFMLDQFEGRTDGTNNLFRWDGEGWMGTDMNRLWVKSEGFAGNGTVSDGDQEALYDRPIPRMRYFDAQAGLRVDGDSGPTRLWFAAGMEGLAPYHFQFAPTFYIRDGGRVAGRINGMWDIYVNQRIALQPQAELNFYSKDDPARKTGSGFSGIDAGVRLRYEITRKFAPYIGWAYADTYGNSALYRRRSGEPTRSSNFVFGIRLWY
jgi:copper resistance protein B